jgi:hypothetical protein
MCGKSADRSARFESGNPDPREGTLFPAFLSNVKIAPSELLLPILVARLMLNGSNQQRRLRLPNGRLTLLADQSYETHYGASAILNAR